MTEKMYVVTVSKNGHKRKETVAAPNGVRAERQVRQDHPNGIIYNVDTL